MKLSFLGTGSAYNPLFKNTSAYAFFGTTLLLLDCGETVFETLYKNDILQKAETILIAVTHFHSDHIGSLGSTLSYCSCILKKKVYLFYPTSDICDLLAITGVPSSMYEYCDKTPLCMPFTISAIEVQHDPMIKSYGYLISNQDSCIFYGGDSIEIPSVVLDGLKSGRVAAVYQDVSYEHAPCSRGHGTLERLEALVSPELRSRVVCMHFGYDFSKHILESGFIPATREA